MGVDAEMFARIKGRENWLKPQDELAAAYALASTIGADNFMITKGGDLTWSQHHALSIVQPVTAQDIKDNGWPQEWLGKTIWTQDGDEIVAGDDEQFVQVHFYGRYYGPDYARGDWPVIRATAEWLETRFPGCEVWYGGDSSGICAELFDARRRDEINRFYLESGHRTYTGAFDGIFGSGHKRPVCRCCEAPMRDTGGGAGQTFWYCDGCDGCEGKAITTATDVRWLKRGEDFFSQATKGAA